MATDIMALHGVPSLIFLALRYGGHISSALWVTCASWQAKGTIRIIGVIYAIILALYSYLPGASFVILLPTAILFPAWLLLVGRLLAKGYRQQPSHVEIKV